MSNDTNYIKPTFNAHVKKDIPVIAREKMREAVVNNLSNDFIDRMIIIVSKESNSVDREYTFDQLIKDIGAYLDED